MQSAEGKNQKFCCRRLIKLICIICRPDQRLLFHLVTVLSGNDVFGTQVVIAYFLVHFIFFSPFTSSRIDRQMDGKASKQKSALLVKSHNNRIYHTRDSRKLLLAVKHVKMHHGLLRRCLAFQFDQGICQLTLGL